MERIRHINTGSMGFGSSWGGKSSVYVAADLVDAGDTSLLVETEVVKIIAVKTSVIQNDLRVAGELLRSFAQGSNVWSVCPYSSQSERHLRAWRCAKGRWLLRLDGACMERCMDRDTELETRCPVNTKTKREVCN